MRVNEATIVGMDSYEVRYRNLRMLIEQMEKDAGRDGFARAGGLAMLAEKLGKQQAQVNHFASESRVKNIGPKIAREIDAAFGRPAGWLDQPHWVESAPSPVSLSDATAAHSLHPAIRRIRIEGAVEMDEQGFWQQGDRDAEETTFPTDDPDAYAVRVLAQTFQPALASGQCVLVSPREELRAGRPALVILMDGRRTLRNFHSHERGVWTFTKVNDGNAFLSFEDAKVAYVERVMAYLWTD